jgi:putative FmdB family regulatory protein
MDRRDILVPHRIFAEAGRRSRGYRGKPRLSVKLRPLVGELHFRRFAMPTYDFRCDKCKKKFTLIMAISEYEKTKIRCPKCKSTRVKQQITPFQVVTSKKS